MINKIKTLFTKIWSRRRINKYVKEMERQEKILSGQRQYYRPPIPFEGGVPPSLLQKLLGLISQTGQEIHSTTDPKILAPYQRRNFKRKK